MCAVRRRRVRRRRRVGNRGDSAVVGVEGGGVGDGCGRLERGAEGTHPSRVREEESAK